MRHDHNYDDRPRSTRRKGKTPAWVTMLLCLAGAVACIGALVVLMIGVAFLKPKGASTPEELPVVTAVDLMGEFKTNEVAANGRYKGKRIAVAGVVTKIATDVLDRPYLLLQVSENPFGLEAVRCAFAEERPWLLATLKPGDVVGIIGTCEGKFALAVHLKGCRVESVQASEEPAK